MNKKHRNGEMFCSVAEEVITWREVKNYLVLTVGIAEATVATAAALAPARVASAAIQFSHASVRECIQNEDAAKCSMCHFNGVPREQRLARASFWSREARLTVAIFILEMYAKS